MTHMRAKLIVVSIVLIGAVTYLGLAGAEKGWVYYLDVDTYLVTEEFQAQRVRLAGRVDEEGFEALPAQLTARFNLLGPTRKIAVVFRNDTIPNNFEPGVDVVIEGKADELGVFQADTLMTKCASKYQAEEHAKRLEQTP